MGFSPYFPHASGDELIKTTPWRHYDGILITLMETGVHLYTLIIIWGVPQGPVLSTWFLITQPQSLNSSRPSDVYMSQQTTPSHYLNKCRLIVSCNVGNKFQWRFETQSKEFHCGKCIWNLRLWNGGHMPRSWSSFDTELNSLRQSDIFA